MPSDAPGRATGQPIVVLAANPEVLARDVPPTELARLREVAEVRLVESRRPSSWDGPPPPDEPADARFVADIAGAAALVVSHGAPRVTGAMMDACPSLRFIGELEGDRFAYRIDTEAAWARGIRTVDTTNGSSSGVAEWALALMLIGLRDAGAWFRRIVIDRQERFYPEYLEGRGYRTGELTGRRVGLIGCGHTGRRLLELLAPFRCVVSVHDPYAAPELADIYDLTLTSLDAVMASSDVVVCTVPLTPGTQGMVGARELGLLRDESVFVNVSRGAVVRSDALIDELRRGRIVACLDVFDPEPIPVDSPVRDLPNVFLSPHIAGVTAAGRARSFRYMVDELERHLAGHRTRYDLLPRTTADRRGEAPPPRV